MHRIRHRFFVAIVLASVGSLFGCAVGTEGQEPEPPPSSVERTPVESLPPSTQAALDEATRGTSPQAKNVCHVACRRAVCGIVRDCGSWCSDWCSNH